MYTIPEDRYYDRERHMWALPDTANDCIRVGIDSLGVGALGDLAYVSLLEPGTEVSRGASMGTLEAAKMTGEIIAPVSGVIVKRNDAAIADPSVINQAPYENGWIVEIQPHDWANESAQLVSGDAIASWATEEIKRYRQQGLVD